MKNIYFFFIALSLALISCQKEDTAVVLPPPGNVKQMTVVMGPNYDNQIYVSLSQGTAVTRPYRPYDLAFEASESGIRLYVNDGKLMFVANTHSSDMLTADSTGKEWAVDQEHYHPDSSAFRTWWNNASLINGGSEVFVVDRGRYDFTGANRFRKIQIVSVDDSSYHIRYSKYDNSELADFTIPKNHDYSLMYFSFDSGGQMVNQGPAKNDWDLLFTKYTHIYFEEPIGSPFRYYSVNGAILNVWNNTSGSMLKKDSLPNYEVFDTLKYANVSNYNFSNDAAVIGFDWKYYDFNNSRYYIRPDQYYIIKDKDGLYYKIRMLDFYDQQGFKGTITFEYQRI
ncbi:hypothetical protein BH11BAC2_BH11BAC2_18140 [soil metagenome]